MVAGCLKVVWRAEVKGDSLQMTHVSPDGDEHYPGEVSVTVIYRLTDDNELEIIFRANTTRATPINLTSHAYFNLAEEVVIVKIACASTQVVSDCLLL
jgi:aldose 1-epimerase